MSYTIIHIVMYYYVGNPKPYVAKFELDNNITHPPHLVIIISERRTSEKLNINSPTKMNLLTPTPISSKWV